MDIIKITIKGTTPIVMHSERLANPFNPMTKMIKAITSKKKKTEEDLMELARIEFLGGLYYNETDGVHVPGYNVLATVIGGGKICKLGTSVKRSVLIAEDAVPVIYEGPKDPESLYADPNFIDVRGVKVGTSKVMRCRPIFKQWALKFTALYDEESIQRDEVIRCVSDAGAMVGLGDYRPRFGRFSVESMQ